MKTKTSNVSSRNVWLRDNITKYSDLSAIIILLIALPLTRDNFLGTSNPKNLLRDTASPIITFVGMIMVLLFGSIDLPVGTVCFVSNVTYVYLKLVLQDSFSSLLLTGLAAMVVSPVFGLAFGLALGIIHVKLKVLSFIASLGFIFLQQSVALLTMQNLESVPKTLWGIVEWYRVAFDVVGPPLIVAVVIILFIHCVTRYTPSGRTIFAIDGNERTTRVTGTGMNRTKIPVFATNGVLAALAGIFLAANLRSSVPTIGDPFTLEIVAACVLDGTSLTGDKGDELGTILGVFTVVIVGNGMNLIGVNAYYQSIVFGIFVLAAIAPTVDRSIRSRIVR